MTGAGVAVGHLDTAVDTRHVAFRAARRTGRLLAHRADHQGRLVLPADAGCGGLHGTHIASVLVGRSDTDGFVGVAPDALLRTCAVIDDGLVVARIATALDWLIGTDLAVVLLPIGIAGDVRVLDSLLAALAARDVVVVVPSGNRGAGHLTAPAAHPSCLSIGAMDSDARVAPFSGSWVDERSGRVLPDLCATGVNVRGAAPGGAYASVDGTSVAAAQVAGWAALLRAAHPTAKAETIRNALVDAADEPPDDQWMRARRGAARPLRALARLEQERPTAFTPSRRVVDETPGPRIDERLLRWLETARGPEVDFVMEFCDAASAHEVAQAIVNDARDASAPPPRVLNHAPVLVARAPKRFVRDLLNSDRLKAAGAADVNRWQSSRLSSPRSQGHPGS